MHSLTVRKLWAIFIAVFAVVGNVGIADGTDVPRDLRDRFKFETVRLSGTPFHLMKGDFYSLYIEGRPRYVKTIWIRAEAMDRAAVEVIANGTPVSQFRLEGQTGPMVMVNVRDTVTSLEFRHLSGAPVHILEIMATRSLASSEDWAALDRHLIMGSWSDLKPTNTASQLAKRAIDLVEKLRPFVDPRTDYVDYLLPIKTSAGTAYSVAQAYGDGLSMQTRQAMKDLSFSIGQAQRVISDLMHIESVFDLAVELRALKHEIDRRLI